MSREMTDAERAEMEAVTRQMRADAREHLAKSPPKFPRTNLGTWTNGTPGTTFEWFEGVKIIESGAT